MRGVAQWDGTKWSKLGGGVNDACTAVTCIDGKVCVAGTFSQVGEKEVGGAAIWDGSQFSTIPKVQSLLVSIATLYNSVLYIGGDLIDPTNPSHRTGILKFDGSKFDPISQ
jgi:hypothetical protein